MENDLKGIENYFELTGGSSYRGLSYRESTVPVNMQSTSPILNLMLVPFIRRFLLVFLETLKFEDEN